MVEDIFHRYQRRATIFEAKVASVDSARWDDPSPCTQWRARDVVGHIVEMHGVMLRPLNRSLTPAPSIEENPLAAFQAARADLEAVLLNPAEAGLESATPAGPQTVAEHIDGVVSADMVLHGWDLARATGLDETIDPLEVARMWAEHNAIPAELMAKLRTPGAFGPGVVVFGPEIVVPADAPLQDRLLGLIGRNPYR